jgi:hypothetical protein
VLLVVVQRVGLTLVLVVLAVGVSLALETMAELRWTMMLVLVVVARALQALTAQAQ